MLPKTFYSALVVLLLGVAAFSSTAGAGTKVAFVTSVIGTGDLGTWPDAGGQTGLAAADQICRSRAAAAGLDNPDDFVAWLSDRIDDAYCRVHGRSGKKSANCGRPNLPVGAGPWVRTDGYPFGRTINKMLAPSHQVLAPIGLDEFGSSAPVGRFWTNTTDDGDLDIGSAVSCEDWTSGSAGLSAGVGATTATARNWTEGAPVSCSTPRPLLCMEQGPGSPLPPFWQQGAKIFVTSAAFDGDLGGISGARLACRNRARFAGVPAPDTFHPWLSDEIDDVSSHVSGLNFPFIRLDGIRVADSGADLLDGGLLAPINYTQYDEYLTAEAVWTGSDWAGNGVTDQSCFFWIDDTPAFTGWVGAANWTTQWWTDVEPSECSEPNHLYCYSAAVVDVFYNDFDSGDTSAWTATVP